MNNLGWHLLKLTINDTTAFVSILGLPKTSPRLSDSLAMAVIYYREGYRAVSRGRRPRGWRQEAGRRASQSPLPEEPYRVLSTPPGASRDHTWDVFYQQSPSESLCPGLSQGAGRVAPSAWRSTRTRGPRRTAGSSMSYFIQIVLSHCTSSVIYRVVGMLLKSKFPPASQGLTLPVGPSKKSISGLLLSAFSCKISIFSFFFN